MSLIKEKKYYKIGIIKGIKAAIPIAIGYIPIAIAFGVISVQSGVSLIQTASMSLMVFAGASQFMAAGMIGSGAGASEIILATFILNLRHFIMSMSVMHRFRDLSKKSTAALAFGVTDETFAVLSMKEENGDLQEEKFFAGSLILTSYTSWVAGTVIGGIFADAIPQSISASMSIGLYAMFIGLLVPAVRESWRIGIISVSGMILCWIFSSFMDTGWAIIFATILAALIGVKNNEKYE
ncbi:MAG: AzlC family ABC transporter permease [Clostridiaceae bacterium]|jgi:4-azaleucine resistance transporter AzlC|nr:AzlC family ABC transporter permease [Clostridiaceae bacterium]